MAIVDSSAKAAQLEPLRTAIRIQKKRVPLLSGREFQRAIPRCWHSEMHADDTSQMAVWWQAPSVGVRMHLDEKRMGKLA